MSKALETFKTAVSATERPVKDLLKELDAMVLWLKNPKNQDSMDHVDAVQAMQGVRLAQRYLSRAKK